MIVYHAAIVHKLLFAYVSAPKIHYSLCERQHLSTQIDLQLYPIRTDGAPSYAPALFDHVNMIKHFLTLLNLTRYFETIEN